MKTEDYYALPVDENGWRTLPNGNRFRLGDRASIGNGETSLHLAELIRATYTGKVLFSKWVTSERKSPNFDGGTPVEYPVGAVLEVPDAQFNDQQCAPGLHVLRYGYRPEWCGLCGPSHDLVELHVEVDAEDICFAGLPGNDTKFRVRKLRVLD